MEIFIIVQDTGESGEAFARRLTEFCKQRSTQDMELSFTTASDGRQTCNIVWNPYKRIKIITNE